MTANKQSVILIIDKDEENQSTLNQLLSSLGHPVMIAVAGKEALQTIEKTPPDLILLDVDLPDMNGLELCRLLCRDPKTRLIPIIIMTASDDKETRIEGIAAGCDDFLPKPFDKLELIVKVGSLLRLQYYRNQLCEKEKFELAMKYSSDAMVIADSDGHIEKWNDAADRFFSLSMQNDLDKDIFAVFKEYYLADPPLDWDLVDRSSPLQFKLHRPESEQNDELILFGKMFAMLDANKEPAGYFVACNDATRRIREEKKKEQFIDLIAHKFRNACTLFMGALSLLQNIDLERETVSADTQRLFKSLYLGSRRMNEIFDRILEISDLLSKKEMIHRTPPVPAEQLPKLMQKICLELGVNHAKALVWEQLTPELMIPLEKKYLEKVCFEILHNISKYCDANDQLKVTISLAASHSGDCELKIQDNGPGIPQEELDHLGERFIQIEKSFSGNLPGLGLGLFLVCEIIEHVGGRLQINSAPQQGVQVLISFPAEKL